MRTPEWATLLKSKLPQAKEISTSVPQLSNSSIDNTYKEKAATKTTKIHKK
jgi:hypothetical protein